jgi:hypothetical protein
MGASPASSQMHVKRCGFVSAMASRIEELAALLIGASCVRSLETAAVALGEDGSAPRFVAALKAGTIEMWDSTCPPVHTLLVDRRENARGTRSRLSVGRLWIEV